MFSGHLGGKIEPRMEIKSRLAPDDGPSTALLKFMETPHDFDAPKEWAGVNENPARQPIREIESDGEVGY